MQTSTGRRLLPAVLILFLLTVLCFPVALTFTFADRAERPGHILSYTRNNLSWDSGTDIRPDGVAVLELFDPFYFGDSVPGLTVFSENGDYLVAPGTEGSDSVRLINLVHGPVTYTAVLYEMQTHDYLPVEVDFADIEGEYEDTKDYPLPDGVKKEHVLRAVRGTVDSVSKVDIGIEWEWPFEISPIHDLVDTSFGNSVPLDEILVGVYIVVEDDNIYPTAGETVVPEETQPEETEPVPEETPDDPEPAPGDDPDDGYVRPNAPQTGDDTPFRPYLALFILCAIVLLLLIWDVVREKKRALVTGENDLPEDVSPEEIDAYLAAFEEYEESGGTEEEPSEEPVSDEKNEENETNENE